MEGHKDVVELLLDNGANKEHRNIDDCTPLQLAAIDGYTNIVKLLLAKDAEINPSSSVKFFAAGGTTDVKIEKSNNCTKVILQPVLTSTVNNTSDRVEEHHHTPSLLGKRRVVMGEEVQKKRV